MYLAQVCRARGNHVLQVGCRIVQAVHIVPFAEIVKIELVIRQIQPLAQCNHARILVLGLGLDTPRPAGLQLVLQEIAVPVQDIGERGAAAAQLLGLLQVAGDNLRVFAQVLGEGSVIAVGHLEGDFLGGHGAVAHHRTRHEDVHHVDEVAVAVDFHGVLVVFKSAPNLAQLTGGDIDFAAGTVAHHHDVGRLGKAVKPFGGLVAVEAVTDAVEHLGRDVTLDVEAQVAAHELGIPFTVVGIFGNQARGEVDVEIEGISLFLQLKDALGERLLLVVLVTTHAGVVALCHRVQS